MDVTLSDGSGVVQRHRDFTSLKMPARYVDVWLPLGYVADATARYPVIYMHDGQNLFDPATSYGGIDWGIDETITRLMGAGKTGGAIVVGIWNTPQRRAEYMPQKPFGASPLLALRAMWAFWSWLRPGSDAYLRFLVGEVKPLIDSAYRTLPGRDHTFVMGSSMGGLISLYALEEYPQVFGGAGCLSTHWPAGGNRLVDAMGAALPRAHTSSTSTSARPPSMRATSRTSGAWMPWSPRRAIARARIG
jgi:predicted alpha/beta superfamily hydrolase